MEPPPPPDGVDVVVDVVGDAAVCGVPLTVERVVFPVAVVVVVVVETGTLPLPPGRTRTPFA